MNGPEVDLDLQKARSGLNAETRTKILAAIKAHKGEGIEGEINKKDGQGAFASIPRELDGGRKMGVSLGELFGKSGVVGELVLDQLESYASRGAVNDWSRWGENMDNALKVVGEDIVGGMLLAKRSGLAEAARGVKEGREGQLVGMLIGSHLERQGNKFGGLNNSDGVVLDTLMSRMNIYDPGKKEAVREDLQIDSFKK